MRNARSGFENSGIFPINPKRFESDFVVLEHQMQCLSFDDSVLEPVVSTSSVNQLSLTSAIKPTISFTPATYKAVCCQNNISITPSTENLLTKLHPKPILQAQQKNRGPSRKQHAECLTSSPFKACLMEKIRIREQIEIKKKSAQKKREQRAQAKEKKLKEKRTQEKVEKQSTKVAAEMKTLSTIEKNEDDICIVCTEGGKNDEVSQI